MSDFDTETALARMRAHQMGLRGRVPVIGAPQLAPVANPAAAGARPDELLMTQQINLTRAVVEALGARLPTGRPVIPDDAVEKLYDLVRNEMLRRQKRV